jgi:hypothetical protein
MIKQMPFLLLLSTVLAGCGPSAHELRERTLSIINTEADKWDGGKAFKTNAKDAYGRALTCSVEKTSLTYVLEVRSNGPDGLPKNGDDIVVTRSKRHGETTIMKEAEKASEGIGRGAASGVIQGVKKGLGLGGQDGKKK